MKILKILIGLVVSSFCFYYAVQGINFNDFQKNLKNIDYLWLSIASLGIILSQWFRAARWQRLLKPIQLITLTQSFQIYSIGNVINLLIPLRGGDFIRAWLVAHQTAIQTPACLATVITERLIDLIIFAGILGICLMIYPLPEWIIWMGGCILTSCLIWIVLFILLKTKKIELSKLWTFLSKKISTKKIEKISQGVDHFLKGIVLFKKTDDYIKFAIETILISFFQGLFIYFLFKSTGLNPIYHLEFNATILMLALTTIAVVVPSSPSYAGTLHLMSFLALKICHVPADAAIVYSIIFHGQSTIISILLGIYGLYTQYSSLNFKSLLQNKEK